MKDVEYDIKMAKDIINWERVFIKYFEVYDTVYTFSNEDSQKESWGIDYKDKKILSVSGSGDHALNAILFGAKEVDCFDINMLTKYYLYLKIGALHSLNHSDFIHFFGVRDSLVEDTKLGYETYQKISKFLPDDIKYFWDSLYSYFNNSYTAGIKIYYSLLFSKTYDPNIAYLKMHNYYVLKDKIKDKKFNFIHTDISDLQYKTSKTYDKIILSNIPEYIDLDEYISLVKNKLNPLLNDSGEILSTELDACIHEKLAERNFFSDIKAEKHKIYIYRKR